MKNCRFRSSAIAKPRQKKRNAICQANAKRKEWMYACDDPENSTMPPIVYACDGGSGKLCDKLTKNIVSADIV